MLPMDSMVVSTEFDVLLTAEFSVAAVLFSSAVMVFICAAASESCAMVVFSSSKSSSLIRLIALSASLVVVFMVSTVPLTLSSTSCRSSVAVCMFAIDAFSPS